MRKGAFIFILYLFFISCQEKTKETKKTYEQLEAKVLCDVLPEVAKYELENSFWLRIPPPPPIPEIDTLKFNSFKTEYLFDSLDIRPLSSSEFEKSNLKVTLITYKNTFEGGIRNSDMPLLFLSRVLLSQDYKKAYFFVFKYYRAYHVFCEFSENRWFIKKIIEEQK